MDMYTKAYCPHCKARNLVWLGDWGRDTGFKAETAVCWSCDGGFLLGDDHEESLYEIILTHFNCEEYTFTERELAKRLLDGETLHLEEDMNLSNFLKQYSDAQKGEKLAESKVL
jgi:hypothetical protein